MAVAAVRVLRPARPALVVVVQARAALGATPRRAPRALRAPTAVRQAVLAPSTLRKTPALTAGAGEPDLHQPRPVLSVAAPMVGPQAAAAVEPRAAYQTIKLAALVGALARTPAAQVPLPQAGPLVRRALPAISVRPVLAVVAVALPPREAVPGLLADSPVAAAVAAHRQSPVRPRARAPMAQAAS